MSTAQSIVFFGTSHFSVLVLETLAHRGIIPALIITAPDAPVGRKQVLTPTPVKIWAQKHNVPVRDPSTLKDGVLQSDLAQNTWDVFVVASYGKIIPKSIIELPRFDTLNIHPSLLPKLRGPSPMQASILGDGSDVGVTVIKLDNEVDHGPILAQKKVNISPWPILYSKLELTLASEGANLLADILPQWTSGVLKASPQAHDEATFTKKIEKRDGLIDLSDPLTSYKKICAYEIWPHAFFYATRNNKQIRVIVKKASFQNGELAIERVVPEGGNEMRYEDFLRGIQH